MKYNTKSSITLPTEELKEVERLRKKLGAKSKVEVVRLGLRLLSEQTDREELRKAYWQAAERVHEFGKKDLEELDDLADEGLADES